MNCGNGNEISFSPWVYNSNTLLFYLLLYFSFCRCDVYISPQAVSDELISNSNEKEVVTNNLVISLKSSWKYSENPVSLSESSYKLGLIEILRKMYVSRLERFCCNFLAINFERCWIKTINKCDGNSINNDAEINHGNDFAFETWISRMVLMVI